MKYFFRNYLIHSQNFNYLNEFQKWNSKNPDILFLENEGVEGFILVSVEGITGDISLKVVFPYNNNIELVKVFIDSKGENLLLYSDQVVYFISINKKKVINRHKLNDPILNLFFELEDYILLIGEISVSAFLNNTIAWQVKTDLITNIKIDECFLSLDYLDAPSNRIDIRTGKLIKPNPC